MVMNVCDICGQPRVNSKNVCLKCKIWYLRYTRRKWCVDYLGGKCENCDTKDVECLEFHHKDPTKKDFMISAFYMSAYENIKDELDKCNLLCSNCHKKAHRTHREDIIEYFKKHPLITTSKKIVRRGKGIRTKHSNRPSREELESQIWEKNTIELGKKYNVVTSTITKWCQYYGIEKPGRGYWKSKPLRDIMMGTNDN